MATPIGQRPVSLIVVAVLSLVLGLMGIGSVLASCATLASGPLWMSQMMQSMGTIPGLAPEYMEAQQQWLDAMRPYLAVQGGLSLATTPLALLLTLGGAFTLAGHERGPGWLRWAFVYGIVLEPIRAVAAMWQMFATWDEMNAFMGVAMTPPPGSPPPPPEITQMMDLMMIGSVGMGLLFAVGWMLMKVALYVFGLRATRDEVT